MISVLFGQYSLSRLFFLPLQTPPSLSVPGHLHVSLLLLLPNDHIERPLYFRFPFLYHYLCLNSNCDYLKCLLLVKILEFISAHDFFFNCVIIFLLTDLTLPQSRNTRNSAILPTIFTRNKTWKLINIKWNRLMPFSLTNAAFYSNKHLFLPCSGLNTLLVRGNKIINTRFPELRQWDILSCRGQCCLKHHGAFLQAISRFVN